MFQSLSHEQRPPAVNHPASLPSDRHLLSEQLVTSCPTHTQRFTEHFQRAAPDRALTVVLDVQVHEPWPHHHQRATSRRSQSWSVAEPGSGTTPTPVPSPCRFLRDLCQRHFPPRWVSLVTTGLVLSPRLNPLDQPSLPSSLRGSDTMYPLRVLPRDLCSLLFLSFGPQSKAQVPLLSGTSSRGPSEMIWDSVSPVSPHLFVFPAENCHW